MDKDSIKILGTVSLEDLRGDEMRRALKILLDNPGAQISRIGDLGGPSDPIAVMFTTGPTTPVQDQSYDIYEAYMRHQLKDPDLEHVLADFVNFMEADDEMVVERFNKLIEEHINSPCKTNPKNSGVVLEDLAQRIANDPMRAVKFEQWDRDEGWLEVIGAGQRVRVPANAENTFHDTLLENTGSSLIDILQ